MSKKILILGANGFIGSHVSEYILAHRDWDITAMDLHSGNLSNCLGNPRFNFTQGNIITDSAWVEARIKECDIVLPLVAIANPAIYVQNPLAVFELDFEANLDIVRHCVKYNKRIVFPSTSEVYGMSIDTPYDEETSNLTTGPINKERWIYSCSKQMLDRVIYAYGKHHGLSFTLFRPFNWFGPRLDNVWDKEKSSRVVTQFLSNILHKKDIVLVDGGAQKRCFLYVDDAIDALVRILDNNNGVCDSGIFNIGHPENEASIAELADMMIDVMSEFKGYENIRSQVKITVTDGEKYYGKGYQDIENRVPSIARAQSTLGWHPTTDIRDAIRKTIAFYYADTEKMQATA
jgi:nucleoside-diphosphate-sugar epimerase